MEATSNARGWNALAWPAMLGLGTLAALGVFIVVIGQNPLQAFSEFIAGSIGSRAGLGGTAARAAILIFYALGIALSFRAGLINIGTEGQARMGAAAAVALTVGPAGAFFSHHGWIGIPVMLLAGALAGAAWSLLAGAMKRWRGVSEVVATLMLNFAALQLVRYAVSSHAWLQGRDTDLQQNELPAALKFAGLGGTDFHWGALLALPAAVAIHIFLFHSAGGMRLRAMGFNRSAARACGVACDTLTLQVFGASGALAGLAGALGVMAVGKLSTDPPYSDFGYMAVSVALVAELKPLAIIGVALLFAAMDVGSESMEAAAGIPHWIVYVLNGLMILAMLARDAGLRALPMSGPAKGPGGQDGSVA